MKTVVTERYDKDGKLVERIVTTEHEYPTNPMPYYTPIIVQPIPSYKPFDITWGGYSTTTLTSANC